MSRILLLASLLAFPFAGLHAQAEPSPTVTVAVARTHAKGLDLSDLRSYLKAWRQLVAEKDVALTQAAERRDAASGEERKTAEEEVDALRGERDELVKRLEAVLEVYRSKLGAKQAEDETLQDFDSYIDGLESHIDRSSPTAWLNMAWGWLTSMDGGLRWTLRILSFFVILIVSRIVAGIVGRVIRRALDHADRLNASDLLENFFVNTAKRVVFFVGLVIALGQIGLDIGPLLAGIGVMGFVVGFALQGTLSNFASGIMILLYRPYDIGDVVEAAGTTGVVEAMTLVSTTMKTFDNQVVIIPNSSIWGGVITNKSGKPIRRADMTFSISYEDDIAAAEKILTEICAEHPMVLEDPAPLIKVHELADSAVIFICRPWAKTGDLWTMRWDVTREVKTRFEKAGITIPYPQRVVHVQRPEEL